MVLDAALPPLKIQHIWFEMKKQQQWRSVALVPLSDSIRVLGLAHCLGLMAVREPHDLVWIVNASSESGDQVKPEEVSSERGEDAAFPYKFVNLDELGINKEKQLVTAERMLEKFQSQDDLRGKVIFVVDSLLGTTHGISLCRAVDKVILCVALKQTSFKSVRRTIEIIGREKIMGSIVVHSNAS